MRGACHYSYSYGRLTVDKHTHTHTHTHTPSQWCRVTSCHCSLHSVKGKSSVPDLHKHTTPWLLIPHGPFLATLRTRKRRDYWKLYCMYPRNSLFTLNVPININTAVFDASPAFPPEPRHTFIYKTEQLGRTECVCLCDLWRMCVSACIFFGEWLHVFVYSTVE